MSRIFLKVLLASYKFCYEQVGIEFKMMSAGYFKLWHTGRHRLNRKWPIEMLINVFASKEKRFYYSQVEVHTAWRAHMDHGCSKDHYLFMVLIMDHCRIIDYDCTMDQYWIIGHGGIMVHSASWIMIASWIIVGSCLPTSWNNVH